MNRLKKAIATLGVAAALAVPIGTIGQVAAAENSKAQAYSYTQGPVKYQWDWYQDRYNGRYYCGVWAYIDYDWWEETFQGKRDGWYRLYYALC